MCMGSSPSVPATPEVQAAPQEQDAAVVDARDEETRRRRAAAGRSSTLLTGSPVVMKASVVRPKCSMANKRGNDNGC